MLTQIVPLLLLGVLLAVLLCLDSSVSTALFPSPVSPVLPGTSPLVPGNRPPESTLPPPRLPSRLLGLDVWSSPWTWVAMGTVLFGGAAWALIVLFRRFQAGDDESTPAVQPPVSSPESMIISEAPSAPDEHKVSPAETEDTSQIEIDIA